MIWTVILSVALVATVLIWLNTMTSREKARNQAARICKRSGWQLLDETVALSSMYPRRTPKGNLGLVRRWRFEFSELGTDRRRGEILLQGHQTLRTVLESSEGRIIEESETRRET